MKNKSQLESWLRDPRAVQFFGEGFSVKLDVLAWLVTGGNLSEIARKHGVSKQAVSKQAVKARKIFGTSPLG